MDTIETLSAEFIQTDLVFFVNGKKVIESKPEPEWTLLWYLRRKLQLTGTKYGCGEGGCGACTVMVSYYIHREDRIKHMAVNACLTPLCSIHGLAVTTVEGIGSVNERLHPVQERIAKSHGSQCGFCTPGIVMSMYTLLRNKKAIRYDDIESSLQGNLCRCTGYRPIIEGFKTFMEDWEEHEHTQKSTICAMGKNCCKNAKNKNDDKLTKLFNETTFKPHDPTQEPIFPPELKLDEHSTKSWAVFKGQNVLWIRPEGIEELIHLKDVFPNCKIVVGNTEVGVEVKYKNKVYPVIFYAALLPELNFCSISDSGIVIGGATSLTDLGDFLDKIITQKPDQGIIFKAIKNMLHWFAGTQIRNVASLVGNIVTASPISDLNPILMACSAVLNVRCSKRGLKKIIIDDTFFISYRRTALADDEVVLSIEIPFSVKNQYFNAYKQARRRDDDISIVTAAFNVIFEEKSKVVSYANFCFGGMGPTTICADKTSTSLKGHIWNNQLLDVILNSLMQELQLDFSSPGGMVEYRKSLCLSLLAKFYFEVLQKLTQNEKVSHTVNTLTVQEFSDLTGPTSAQFFTVKDCNVSTDAVGKPIPHISAFKQATGEAVYCDDIPQIQGELFLTLVLSNESHAKIKQIDASNAIQLPGVVTFISAADLSRKNKMGAIIKDEEIFSTEIVNSRSCIIGAIVATSEHIARKAKDLVIVTYEPLQPVIITLEDAITKKSYFPGYPRTLSKGDFERVLKNACHVVEGSVRTGAQEHFYLETISAYAIRKEDELEIITTTQDPAGIAKTVSETLEIPNHKVVCKVKRIGGGFGGKETRAAVLAVPVAIAAYRLKKPVRAVLDRDEDMKITGNRHPCLITYKAVVDDNGFILGATFTIYCNAGNSMDISCAMMERALAHVDNCYFIPNMEVKGYLCKTNIPSNTAFRGFGAPQAMLAAEIMIRDIAAVLRTSYETITEINLYREGHSTHYNQILGYCTLSRCWNECISKANYWERKKDVDKFNRINRYKKKGIALVPTKYGISFQMDVLMQAGALLLVYCDGSVLLSIGGIEMGQGLYTKMIQVASRALEIEHTKIHISEMATDKVPNSSPTAASISSDLYGMAVLDACKSLKKRLEPYKNKHSTGKWENWVSAAYLDRVNLSATGFYASPKIEYNKDTNSGKLYEYFTYGAACSEVLVDCLTGDHRVLRTDIVMDVGESLNPAIDIGQIEGAFMQGYGFYTMEEILFSPSGELLSKGPGTYKIPSFSDIPKVFNVSLLKGAPNPRAVYSSKAIGEPPLFLASSVYFAIKEAVKSARLNTRASSEFVLDLPATCANIRMACEDQITIKVQETITKHGSPWNVVA